MAFNKPFSSSSHAAPPEWKSKIATLNNEDVRVYEPTNTTTPEQHHHYRWVMTSRLL